MQTCRCAVLNHKGEVVIITRDPWEKWKCLVLLRYELGTLKGFQLAFLADN